MCVYIHIFLGGKLREVWIEEDITFMLKKWMKETLGRENKSEKLLTTMEIFGEQYSIGCGWSTGILTE